jgi:hypothetical protein
MSTFFEIPTTDGGWQKEWFANRDNHRTHGG